MGFIANCKDTKPGYQMKTKTMIGIINLIDLTFSTPLCYPDDRRGGQDSNLCHLGIQVV